MLNKMYYLVANPEDKVSRDVAHFQMVCVVITRFTTGGYDIFITCPAKSMHRGLEVHAFCVTGDENIMPTCREAGN